MPFNGTIHGSPTFSAGQFGNALNCSTGNGCSFPTDGPLHFATGAPWTVEFWFKKASPPSGLAVLIGFEGVWIGFGGDASGHITLATAVNGTSNVCDGSWHAIAMVCDGSNLSIYVDGTRQVTSGFSISSPDPDAETVGTGFGGGTTYDTTFSIDELRVSGVRQYTGASYTPASSAFANDASGTVALYHFDGDVTDSYAPPVAPLAAAGNIFASPQPDGSVQLTVHTTGGTAPLAYAWYRSTTANFTPGSGNLLTDGGGISGSTTATLADASTLTPGTAYYYCCHATDASSGSVLYPHRPVYAPLTTIKVCAIGDSIEYWVPPYLAAALESSGGIRAVTMVNAAVPGSSTNEWWNGLVEANLSNALAACGGSFAGYLVMVRLGMNDAQGGRDVGTFTNNMMGLLDYIKTHGGVPFLHHPTWREPGHFAQGLEYEVGAVDVVFDESTTPLLLSYNAALPFLVDGTTVIAGDRASYALFAEQPQTYLIYGTTHTALTDPGAIHPSAAGSQAMAQAEAAIILNYLFPAVKLRPRIVIYN